MDACGLKEFDFYIAPDGEVYPFDDGADRFLLSFTGYGMPPVEYVTERGPFQHGATFLDYRLSARVVQLIHRRNADNRDGWWGSRFDILNHLRPNRQTSDVLQMGALRKVLPDGAVRDLDVLIQQGPAFGPRGMENWDEWSWQEELRFVAGDPTFYDPQEQEVVWAIQELGGLYFFAAAYPDNLFSPWSFGSDVVTGQQQVHYVGTWLTYPTFYLTGPLNHPTVSNLSTGERIELAYDILAGEQVIISLPFGNKSVVNNANASVIDAVTDDSDLATFHLAPEPEAAWCGTVAHGRPCGLNVINVEGSGGVAGQTQIRMAYKTRFIGI